MQQALDPDLDYIVGNALMTEAASVLRKRGLTDRIPILGMYFTHGVFRGIKRGRMLLAPTDAPVVQGRISLNQAVRIFEGRPYGYAGHPTGRSNHGHAEYARNHR